MVTQRWEQLTKTLPSSETAVIRVLFVDDDIEFLKVAKQMLELQGAFHVETASSVKEAMKKISEKTFDVIVSDYQLPEENGLDFLAKLHKKSNTIPFIMFTGKGREEVAIKALNLGADRYFNKIGHPAAVYGELAHGICQTVTQRKAKLAIWDREERLRAIIASSPDAMIIMDIHGTITDCNLETLKLLEFSKKDIIGKDYYTLPVKEDRKKVLDAAKELIEQGTITHQKCSLLTKSGQEIPVEYSANILRDAFGNFVGAVSLARNITERKQMEQALQQSEEKYRIMVEQAPDAIFTFDLNGTVASCNLASLEITGFPEEELVGKLYSEFVPFVNSSKELFELYHYLFAGGIPEPFEVCFQTKSGDYFFGEVHTSLLKKGETITGFQAILRDITRRKKAERALRESEKKFRELSELLPEVIFETNTKGVITFVNHESYSKFGYSEEDFEKGLTALQMIAPVDRNRAKERIGKVLSGESVGPNEYKAIRRDGHIFPIIVNSTPIINEDKVVGLRGVMVDITEHMKTENVLKETLKNLETVNEKLSVVGRLTRHDARNKLAVITNNIFLVKQQLTRTESVSECLDAVESTVEQMEKIFDFARIYEKLGTEKLTTVNVKKSVDEAFLLSSCSDEIKLVSDCECLMVMADSLLRQLFYNLIDNTLKHGEKVTQIKLYYKEDDKQLTLFYEDNGVGIPDDEKTKIFREGYGKGTGYGLYLIQKICDVYCWTIKETGVFGKGVQFTITIPKTTK